MMPLKRALVWSLEAFCGVLHHTTHRLPQPNWLLDKDYWWEKYLFACQLGSYSAELDEKWNTGIWTVPSNHIVFDESYCYYCDGEDCDD